MAKETSTQALRPGTRLRSKELVYDIIKVLGSGSFGITYLASSQVKVGNISTVMKFAIKEHFMSASCYRSDDGVSVVAVPSAKADVAESRNDFIMEANRLKNLCLKSRNIVSVNETFEANGTAYYVMEFLDGGSLSRCPEDEAVSVIMQITDALKEIHKEKVLHLDIKPDNIVFKTNDEKETYPVLIDFGISKHFNAKNKPTSSLNAKGASPGYAPQEQYAGVNGFSPKYDIYALGAVLFFLCTGKNPPDAFKVSPNQQELKKELEGKVSSKIENAILKAMSPRATDRTPSIEQFCKDLMGDDFVSVNQGGGGTVVFSSSQTWWKRHRKGMFQTLGVALICGCVLVVWKLIGPTKDKESIELTEAIANMDGVSLKKFAEEDSARAYLPYARFLINQGQMQAASLYARKAMETADSVKAKDLINSFIADNSFVGQSAAQEESPEIQSPAEVEEEPQQNSNEHIDNRETPVSVQEGKPEPVRPVQTSGTLSLGYATWKGGIKNGRPDGKGRLTFGSTHLVDKHSSQVANPGDYFIATYDNGSLISGRLYDEGGNLIKTIIP